MEGEEEDDDQRVLERGEWFEGKRQKENEKMKATDSNRTLKSFYTALHRRACATVQLLRSQNLEHATNPEHRMHHFELDYFNSEAETWKASS